MDAAELYKQSGESVNVWFCGKCGTVGWNKDAAERCCIPHKCKTCGKAEPTAECNDCYKAREQKKELERFEKADKVTTWDGWIYLDGYGYKDGYFESVADLEDYLADHPDSRPEYAWTCSENQFVSVDTDSLYEQIEERGYEDFGRGELNGTDELEAAIKIFEKANESIVSYEPDYSKALLLAPFNTPEAGRGDRKVST